MVLMFNCSFWNNSIDGNTYQLVSQFATFGNIRHLSIDYNVKITESSVNLLFGEDSCLRSLSLRGNEIRDQIAKIIALNLKTNRVMISLDLFDNRIGKLGAEFLGDALKHNSTLQILNLGKNFIEDEGLLALLKVVEYLHRHCLT
jgi:Ran GTPase-activating protein (RanGAP) involved in mRNA processing and transport